MLSECLAVKQVGMKEGMEGNRQKQVGQIQINIDVSERQV